jgi:hypothetical protein
VLIKSHVLYFARWACNVNVAIIFCSSSARASFACASGLQFSYISPEISVWLPVIGIYMELLLIISLDFIFHGSSDTQWCFWDFLGRADVCAGATPHSQRSEI